MTTDASRDARDRDVPEDDATDAGRPSLADWLVVSVRPSQMPPAPLPSSAPEVRAEPSGERETPADLASNEPASAGAADEDERTPLVTPHLMGSAGSAPLPASEADRVATPDDGLVPPAVSDAGAQLSDLAGTDTPDADTVPDAGTEVPDDDADVGSSRSLTPQIFSAQDPELVADEADIDEALAAVLLSPAARARRAALVRAAFFLLGAVLVLFFLGRWLVHRRGAETVASVAAPAPLPSPPPPAVSAAMPEPEETLAQEEEPSESEPSPGAVESIGRGSRAAPPDPASTAPIVAPAWSVARFPDLPRDVLIACEQAAAQAHSAAPAETAAPVPAPPLE